MQVRLKTGKTREKLKFEEIKEISELEKVSQTV